MPCHACSLSEIMNILIFKHTVECHYYLAWWHVVLHLKLNKKEYTK